MAASVSENHQGKSAFTGLGESIVGELLVGVTSNREPPADTILSHTDYKAVKINNVDGMKRAISGLSNQLYDEDYIKSSGGKKRNGSVIDSCSSMYDSIYKLDHPVMPARQLIEVRSYDLDNREDDLTNVSVCSVIYVSGHGMCYGVYDNGITHKLIDESPPYHRGFADTTSGGYSEERGKYEDGTTHCTWKYQVDSLILMKVGTYQ